ncbi:MAG: TonB family protein [Pseudomonadota bacterium]
MNKVHFLAAASLALGIGMSSLTAPVAQAADAQLEKATSSSMKKWGRKVSHQLRNAMVTPVRFESAREYGSVTYTLTVGRDGQILSAEEVMPSRYDRLNQAAAQTIDRLGQFSPFPDTVDAVAANVHLKLAYKPLPGSIQDRRLKGSADSDLFDLAQQGSNSSLKIVWLDSLPENAR